MGYEFSQEQTKILYSSVDLETRLDCMLHHENSLRIVSDVEELCKPQECPDFSCKFVVSTDKGSAAIPFKNLAICDVIDTNLICVDVRAILDQWILEKINSNVVAQPKKTSKIDCIELAFFDKKINDDDSDADIANILSRIYFHNPNLIVSVFKNNSWEYGDEILASLRFLCPLENASIHHGLKKLHAVDF